MADSEEYYPNQIIGKILKIKFGDKTGIYQDEYIEEFKNGHRTYWNTPTDYLKNLKTGIMMLYDPERKGITVEFKVYDVESTDGNFQFSNKFKPEDVKIFEPAIPISTILKVPGLENFKSAKRTPAWNLSREQYDTLLSQYHGNGGSIVVDAEGKSTLIINAAQLEMVKEAVVSMGGKCKNQEIKDYVLNKWPDKNLGSIDDAINVASVNRQSRVNYSQNRKVVNSHREKYDFLFSIERGMVELYDPDKHGNWGIFQFRDGFRIYKGREPPQTYDYQATYGVIYDTDVRWLEFLKGAGKKIINFWNFGPADLNSLYEDMPFFFKTEGQKIEGMATFVRMERMNATEAWAEFESGNGAPDKKTFLDMLKKDSIKDVNIPEKGIMCIVLRDPVFFNNPPTLSSCGISTFQTMRYIDSIDASAIMTGVFGETPDLEDIPNTVNAPYQSSSVSLTRPYQVELKESLMKTYDSKCAICELDMPELLRVSHIIPHSKNEITAKNLDNSILLCTFHDSLFDRGFITILYESGKYTIKISDLIKNSNNSAIQGIYASLSNSVFHKPLKWPPCESSLEYHNKKIFIDNK